MKPSKEAYEAAREFMCGRQVPIREPSAEWKRQFERLALAFHLFAKHGKFREDELS